MTLRTDGGLATNEPPSPPPGRLVTQGHRMHTRFAVHLLLLATFAASLATVTLITEGLPHLGVGLAFVTLVGVHVVQRRHTAARLREPGARPYLVPPPRAAGVVRRRPRRVDLERAGFGDLRPRVGQPGDSPPTTSVFRSATSGGTSSLRSCCSCTCACTSRAAGAASGIPPFARTRASPRIDRCRRPARRGARPGRGRIRPGRRAPRRGGPAGVRS